MMLLGARSGTAAAAAAGARRAATAASSASPRLAPRPAAAASRRRRQQRSLQAASASGRDGSGASSPDQQQPGAAAGAPVTAAAAALAAPAPPQQDDAASPFLDPLVRSLFLGVGAGIACEAAHVFLKAVSMMEAGALPNPFSSDMLQQFSPAFVADHAVAIGAWLLLYAVEAAAIMGIMKTHPGQPAQELPPSSLLAVLPSRKMFPASLTPVKELVAHTLAAGAAATASSSSSAAAAAALQAVAAPPGLSKELEKALQDIEQSAGSSEDGGAGSSGTAVAQPPVKEGQDDAADRPTTTTDSSSTTTTSSPSQRAGSIKGTEHLRPRRQQQQQEQVADPRQPGTSRRDKELRDRGSYLKNFWYAAALSSKLPADKPLGVDILGSRITLFRDESGGVVALDDTCPHRGAPLSAGWTANDPGTGKKCVVCPYHGWSFDSAGKLADVPSADRGSWPKRPLVGSYAVQERGGFVWLFYGPKSMPAEERPPIPCMPELEDPGWRAVYGEIEFDCGHWGVFENAIDMAHIHYLHGDSFGNSEKPKVMDMQSTRDTFETTCTFRIHNKPVNKMWEWTAVPSVPVTAKAMLPSTSAVTIELAHGVKMITFVNTVPISEHRAINRFCLIRNFALSPAFDFMARDNMYKILGEDKVMVDRLAPERLEVEYSLIAFRQLRQEFIDFGYGVPPESELPRRGGLLPPGY